MVADLPALLNGEVAVMEIAVEAVYTQFIVTLLLLLEFTLLLIQKKKKNSPQGRSIYQ